jgi:hypothetical protein
LQKLPIVYHVLFFYVKNDLKKAEGIYAEINSIMGSMNSRPADENSPSYESIKFYGKFKN